MFTFSGKERYVLQKGKKEVKLAAMVARLWVAMVAEATLSHLSHFIFGRYS